jgi:phytol kinase
MALADGFAAIIGTKYGVQNKYHMFGRAKSMVGSMTFFAISLAVLIGYSMLSDNGLAWSYVLITASVATVLENVAALGFDNLLVPVAVGVLLQAVA